MLISTPDNMEIFNISRNPVDGIKYGVQIRIVFSYTYEFYYRKYHTIF